jgi:hypothetical protein
MKVSCTKLLSYTSLLLALLSAVAAAAFTIAKYAKEAEIASYRLTVERQDRRIGELQERLKEKNAQTRIVPLPQIVQKHTPDIGTPSVRILSPNNTVSQFADVKYELTGTLPLGFKSILVVRDPLGNWWSWGTTDSSTYYSVQFGVDIDRGKQFELRIIVSDDDFPLNQPRRTLPQSIASSAVVLTRQ